MNQIMKKAGQEALEGIKNNEGGPFGCVITDLKGNIIASGHNQVLKNNDPTAHGEIVAIRNACQELNTYDLSNRILYTTAEPCPMCLSAIIWSNIKKVYYGCNKLDTQKIGFRDDMIYEYIKGKEKNILELICLDRKECLKIFKEYVEKEKTIY